MRSPLLNCFYEKTIVEDVTYKCSFDFSIQPISRYPKIIFTNITGQFIDGEIITGATSQSVATIFSQYNNFLYLTDVSSPFSVDEIITGQTSGATATVSSYEPELTYPDNIITGSFPDSIISGHLKDYIEWESTLQDVGYSAQLIITLPQLDGIYKLYPVVGFNGVQIDNLQSQLAWTVSSQIQDSYKFGDGFSYVIQPIGQYSQYGKIIYTDEITLRVVSGDNPNTFILTAYQQSKGTFGWRIYGIKVLKFLV